MMNSLQRLRGSTQDVARLCKWAGAFVLISAVGLSIWDAVSPLYGFYPSLDLRVYRFWDMLVRIGQYGILLILLGEITLLFQPPVESSELTAKALAASKHPYSENDNGTAPTRHNVILEDLATFFANLWRNPVSLGYWSSIFILLSEISLAIWAAAGPGESFREAGIDRRLQTLWTGLVNGIFWGLLILVMTRIVDWVQKSKSRQPPS